MALRDFERTMSLRRFGRPKAGMTTQGYLYLALLIGALSFIGYMTYSAARPFGPAAPVVVAR